jgi:hypothetical protein
MRWLLGTTKGRLDIVGSPLCHTSAFVPNRQSRRHGFDRSESARQEQISLVLVALEQPRGRDAEPELEALRLLLVGAIVDQDDYALRLSVDGLHKLLVSWLAGHDASAAVAETRGELRGLHNVASMALERMVPLAILAELSPHTLPQVASQSPGELEEAGVASALT